MSEVRAPFIASVRGRIEAAGFSTADRTGGFKVVKDGLVIGDLTFYSVHASRDGSPVGRVEFDSRWATGDGNTVTGRYSLKYGDINMKNLLRRLRELVPLAIAGKAKHEAAEARRKSDRAVRIDLVGLPDDDDNETLPAGMASLSVWDGKVDIKLADLSPDVAKKVLDLLKGR